MTINSALRPLLADSQAICHAGKSEIRDTLTAYQEEMA
jgi:hypothetical protein